MEPYDQGYEAWGNGASIGDNPYPPLYAEHEEWDTGWNDAADDNDQHGVGA